MVQAFQQQEDCSEFKHLPGPLCNPHSHIKQQLEVQTEWHTLNWLCLLALSNSSVPNL